MIIAIPVDENKEDVCVSFGRTPYFLFKNTETDTIEICENPAANAEGGAGVKAAQFMVDKNVNVIITVRCGENGVDVFKSADIKVYKSQQAKAVDNLALFEQNSLAILDHFHKGFHGKI